MLMREIATQLYAASRSEDPSFKGIKGLATGLAFSALARRTPVGAALIAGVLIARRFYTAGQRAQAVKEQTGKTMPAAAMPQAAPVADHDPVPNQPLDRAGKAPARRKTRLAILH